MLTGGGAIAYLFCTTGLVGTEGDKLRSVEYVLRSYKELEMYLKLL